jgi:hypothetical protein
LNRLIGALPAGADLAGRILGAVGFAHSSVPVPTRENADSVILFLADAFAPQPRLDTIARVRGRGPGGLCISTRGERGRRVGTCNPVATEDLALLFPDGWVAVAGSDPYRVDWRSPEGQWTRGTPIPVARTAMDDREKCAFLARRSGGAANAPCDPSPYAWPSDLPPYLPLVPQGMAAPASSTLFAVSDGRLLIRRISSASSSATEYDLIDRRGVLVGTLTLPPNEAVVGFGKRAVYVVATDDVDLQTLRRHPWS